jgi:hypothetical protein
MNKQTYAPQGDNSFSGKPVDVAKAASTKPSIESDGMTTPNDGKKKKGY